MASVETGKPVMRRAKAEEVPEAFGLIVKRVRWMDEKGIRLWNVLGYLEIYPESYYSEQQSLGTLYVLETEGRITGTAVLLEQDERWPDTEGSKACYVHNFATDPAVKGAGRFMLAEIEKLAAARGEQYVRLDCSVDNAFLNQYYGEMGYELAGTCSEGSYHGNRREKII